jgi:NADH:ubiquinone oxidoreductase subunit 3 (subunit A)
MPGTAMSLPPDTADWVPAVVFLALAAIVPATMVIANLVLKVRAKVNPPDKLATYECGEEPDGDAWIKFHPRYYVVALVFVVFDVEAAFLLPWALGIRSLGWFAIVEMVVFLFVLLVGWLYALRKGALQWQ